MAGNWWRRNTMGGRSEHNQPAKDEGASERPADTGTPEGEDLIGDAWMGGDEGGSTPTDADGGARDGAGDGSEVARLRAELEETKARMLRVMADYQNYERRAIQNQLRAKQDGSADVAMGVVGVLDHFDLALSHDASKSSAEQVIAGVRVIRDELIKALGRHGVGLISPARGDEFQPGRHEAIMQKSEEGVQPGQVVMTFQLGYTLGDRVLRPAKVAVAP